MKGIIDVAVVNLPGLLTAKPTFLFPHGIIRERDSLLKNQDNMTDRKITAEQFEAMTMGFLVPEMDTYKGASWEDYSDIVAVSNNPDAFEDGLKLKKDVLMVYSADHESDYQNDRRSYDKRVAELNQKYGTIAYTIAEIDAVVQSNYGEGLKKPIGYGLIGLRYNPWGSVQTTTIVAGERITITDSPKEDLAIEDAKIRREMGI